MRLDARNWFFVAAVLIGITAYVLLGGREQRESQRTPGSDPQELVPPTARQESRNTAPDVEQSAQPRSLPERVGRQAEAHRGSLSAGVVFTWTPISVGGREAMDWSSRDWRESAARGRTWGQVADDSVVPDLRPDELTRDGVLWATARGRRAVYVLTPSAGESASPLVLESAPTLRARVVDSQGRPAANVEIRHMGKGGWHHPSDLELAGAHFLRTGITGEDGIAEFSPVGVDSVLVAERGDLFSTPVMLAPSTGGERVLVLGPTFRVAGSVAVPSEAGSEPPIEIHCLDISAGRRELLRRVPVGPGGAWGPAELARREGGTYAIRLEGGGLVPEERRTEVPAGGAFLRFDFVGELGQEAPVYVFEAPVFVFEPEGEAARVPVAGARVSITWSGDDGWTRAFAWTDGAGRALVRGCPRALAWLRAEKEGYVDAVTGSVGVPFEGSMHAELFLGRAGSLSGRCTSDGVPVEEFQVVYWTDDPARRAIARFHDRPDGSFELRSVPLGTVHVTACAPDLPECEVVQVQVTAGANEELELELPAPTVGHGRVLDLISEEPISGAYVLPYALAGGVMVAPREPRRFVDADGSYRLQVFASRECRLEIGAPGYPSKYVTGTPGSDGEIDFGVVLLAKTQPLEIRLEGPEPFDVASIEFWADGPTLIPYTRFPPNGRLRFEEVSPGLGQFYLGFDGGSSLGLFPELIPGREWVFTFPYSREPITHLEVVPPEGEQLSADWVVGADFRIDGRIFAKSLALPADGRVEIAYVPVPDFDVEVLDEFGTRLGATYASFAPGEERFIRLQLGGRSLRVRCVDAQDRPLSHVRIQVTTLEGEGHLEAAGETGAGGELLFHGMQYERLVIDAKHPDAGMIAGVIVELQPEGETLAELQMDATAPLSAVARDGAEPLAGIELRLYAARSWRELDSRTTAADGAASWGRVKSGAFRIEADPPGCWPVRHEFAHSEGGPPLDLEVRRLGSGAWTLIGPAGLPLAGLTVSLWSVEFETEVAVWLESGEVPGGLTRLTTDALGILSIEGLPHGPYVLGISLADVAPRSFSVEVPPRATARATLRLDE